MEAVANAGRKTLNAIRYDNTGIDNSNSTDIAGIVFVSSLDD